MIGRIQIDIGLNEKIKLGVNQQSIPVALVKMKNKPVESIQKPKPDNIPVNE